jgi:hypothetical protein
MLAPKSKLVYHSTMPSLSSESTLQASTLKTPQELIHIQHHISLRQYKYWILILRSYRRYYEQGLPANPDGFFLLPIMDLVARLGYRPSNAELRDDLEVLRRAPIIYNALCKDGSPAVRGAGFISTWQVSDGCVGFTLPEMLARSVEELNDRDSIFHLLNWSIFTSFNGKHEANLYKLCKDYSGVRRTPMIELSAFRNYMGIAQSEYPEFKALNRYVISDPIKEINNSPASDITVEVVYRREKRRVVSLQFLVQLRPIVTLGAAKSTAFDRARIPIAKELQSEYLRKRESAEISASIDRANSYIDEQTRVGKAVHKVGALYRKAINENWGSQQKSNVVEIDSLIEAKRVENAQSIERAAQKREGEVRQLAIERDHEERLWAAFSDLEPAIQSEIIAHVIGDKKYLRRTFSEFGLTSALVRKSIIHSSRVRRLLGVAADGKHEMASPALE